MKKICAITQVRNDEFFLRKWVTYYGHELGIENLYIYFDGLDQQAPDFCRGANVIIKEKDHCDSVIEREKLRASYLSDRAKELFKSYDVVIGTDADEFLILDPKLNTNLADYLSKLDGISNVSGLGVDIGQHLSLEDEINLTEPLLGQRRFGYLSTRYTKPNTLFKPLSWGSGFHRVKGTNFHLDNNLFLFHFGSMDYAMLEKRNRAMGWTERHLAKRARTIHIISKARIGEWDSTISRIRTMQKWIRPPYAWNKPTTLWLKAVVEVPMRFMGIV